MRRMLIFLLAIGWGFLAYGLHHKLGYEGATGYPRQIVSLAWAAALSLPLLVGGLFANSRDGWRKYLRWGCAGLMAAEGVFLLVFSWLKIFGIPPMLGATLLLWPELRGNVPPVSRRQWVVRSGLWLAGGSLLVWWFWFHNPLPSDREMLQHFTAHRAELEQLVQGYRNYRRLDAFYEESSEDVNALLKKVGVYRIGEAQGGSGYWYSEPYSEHTLQVRKSLEIRSIHNLATNEETTETLKRELPTLFEGVAPIQSGLELLRVTAVIDIALGDIPLKAIKRQDIFALWTYPQRILLFSAASPGRSRPHCRGGIQPDRSCLLTSRSTGNGVPG